MAEAPDTRNSSKPSLAEQDAALRASLPPMETEQPDPMLQMTTGRVGAGGLTLFAAVVIVVLGVVFYGLNGSDRPLPEAGTTASNAAAPAAPASPQKTNNKG